MGCFNVRWGRHALKSNDSKTLGKNRGPLFLLVPVTDRNFADPNRLGAKQLGEVLAKVRTQGVPVELGSGTRLAGYLDVLPRKRIGHALCLGTQDIGMQQGHAFHFRR